MPTKAERTALIFLSAVVLAGGVVRIVRASRAGLRPAPAAEAALDRQRRAADSLAHAPKSDAPAAKRGRGSAKKEKQPSAPPAPVDIDRATVKELEALPRVGPALAQRILEERQAHGPFGSLDALDQRVKGIGPAMTATLAPLVTFSGR